MKGRVVETPIAWWDPARKSASRLVLLRIETTREGSPTVVSYRYQGDGSSGGVRAATDEEAIRYVEEKEMPMHRRSPRDRWTFHRAAGRDRRRSSESKWTVICSDGGRKPDWWNFPNEREARAFAKSLRATGYREVKIVNKSGSSRDVFLAPQGAMFDRVDSKGRTHRFRVAKVGYNMIDLAHVATWDPGQNRWERGSGTLYPVTKRELATMRRAPVRDRRRGRPLGRRARRDQEYEAETLGGWQNEHGGWGERRRLTEEERRQRHREYERYTQSQGEQGVAYDQRRPRRRPRRRR